MESSFDNTTDPVKASARRVGNDASDGAVNLKSTATTEIKSLIADVEDLLARIADLKDADVAKMRTRVLRAVESAKTGITERASNLRRQATEAASTADDYVHDSPWQAVGIAALVGAVVGILATRRS